MKRVLIPFCTFLLGTLPVHAAPEAPSVAKTAASSTNGMNVVVDHYLKIQDALAKDSMDGVSDHARAISQAGSVTGAPKDLVREAQALAKAHDLDELRNLFKPLSKTLSDWAKQAKPSGIHVAYCPMAKAPWLQKGEGLKNPYYGSSMLSCGVLQM